LVNTGRKIKKATVLKMSESNKQFTHVEHIILERPELVGSLIYKTRVDAAEEISITGGETRPGGTGTENSSQT
jgi:hypothetical protein